MIYNILIKDLIFVYFLIIFFSYKYFENYYNTYIILAFIFTLNHHWKNILDIAFNYSLFNILLLSLLESNLFILASCICLILFWKKKNLIVNIYIFKIFILFTYLFIFLIFLEKIELDLTQNLNYKILDKLDLKAELLNGIFFFHPLMFLVSSIIMLNLVIFYSFQKNIKNYYHKTFTNLISINRYIGNNLFLLFVVLSSSIITGAWWAQQELNWNGWWSWDIIELISLVQLILVIISFHKYIYILNVSSLKKVGLVFFISFIALRFHLIITRHTFLIDENLIQNIIYGIIILLYLIKKFNLKITSKSQNLLNYFNIIIHNKEQNKIIKFKSMTRLRLINISILSLIYNVFEILALILFLIIIIGNFLKLPTLYIPTTILMVNINLILDTLVLLFLFIIIIQNMNNIMKYSELILLKTFNLISINLVLKMLLLKFQKNMKIKLNWNINLKNLHILFILVIIFLYTHVLIFNISILFISSCDLYLKTNIFSLNFFSKINAYYHVLEKNNKLFIDSERTVYNKTIFLTKELMNSTSFQTLFGRFNHVSEYTFLNNIISFKNSLGLELFLGDLYYIYIFFLILFLLMFVL